MWLCNPDLPTVCSRVRLDLAAILPWIWRPSFLPYTATSTLRCFLQGFLGREESAYRYSHHRAMVP
jgi:hypothetical protein